MSFALLGAWDDEHLDTIKGPLPQRSRLALYVLPSGCSRYVALHLDGVARDAGVAMLAVDRPGAGAVSMVDSDLRMVTSTDHLISVLEALRVSQVDILTHSAGWFYALELMCRMPALVSPSSRIVFSSPFVPTHLSSSALSLLPASVVRMAPAGGNLLASCGKALTWSAGIGKQLGVSKWLSTPPSVSKKTAQRKASIAKTPRAKFHPPYELAVSQDVSKAIFENLRSENGLNAAVQDLLFCLGKAGHMSSLQLEEWTDARLAQLTNSISIVVLWGDSDGLTPRRGREHLRATLEKLHVPAKEWIMAEGGHDDTTATLEVMQEVFQYLRGDSKAARST